MALTIDQASELVEAMLGELDIEAEVYEGYSGRSMYGATVVAITSDDPGAQMALAYVAAQAGIDFDDLPRRTDSMGRGVVIY